MRPLSYLLLLLVTTTSCAFAQTCEFCKEILKDGLYRTVIKTSKTDFTKDLKSYFQSAQFRSDLKSGRWGAGVEVDLVLPVNGIPTPIKPSIKADASNSEIDTFQDQITKSTSLVLTQSTFDQLKTSIPDADIARIYKDCLADCDKKGFKVYPTYGDRDASFLIRYDPMASSIPMPKVDYFDIINGSGIGNPLKKGDVLRNETIVTTRRNPDLDLVLILQTDQGQASYRIPAQPSGFNKDLPVGTIITSFLNFDQLNNITGNNDASPTKTWTSQDSKWAPCDGRSVPNSKFLRATSQLNVPDLRGVFLRGLNLFDFNPPAGVNPVLSARKDPQDGRSPGHFQPDVFKMHKHGVRDTGHAHNFREAGGSGSSGQAGNSQGLNGTGTTTTNSANIVMDAEGDPDETRPKNVAVFYYIRIN